MNIPGMAVVLQLSSNGIPKSRLRSREMQKNAHRNTTHGTERTNEKLWPGAVVQASSFQCKRNGYDISHMNDS